MTVTPFSGRKAQQSLSLLYGCPRLHSHINNDARAARREIGMELHAFQHDQCVRGLYTVARSNMHRNHLSRHGRTDHLLSSSAIDSRLAIGKQLNLEEFAVDSEMDSVAALDGMKTPAN